MSHSCYISPQNEMMDSTGGGGLRKRCSGGGSVRRATGQGGRSAAARGLVGRDKSARREEIPKTLLTWGGMRLRRGVSGCRSGQDFFFFLFFFGWAPPVVAYKTTPLCRKRPPYMSNPCLYLSINRPVSPLQLISFPATNTIL